jgi:broad specificity phosphatase PhoE
MDKITHILCSPLKRTIATTLLGFEPVLSQGLKLVVYPDLRELGTDPSSTGSSVEKILETFPAHHQIADLHFLYQGWETNKEEASSLIGSDNPRSRAKRVRQKLWELGQASLKEEGGVWEGHDVSRGGTHKNIHIVIVSHGAFLKTLLGLPRKFWLYGTSGRD